VYVEQDCTITHEDQSFEAGGAVVTPEYAIGYPDGIGQRDHEHFTYFSREFWGDEAVVKDWHGNLLGYVTNLKPFKQWNPACGYHIQMFQLTAVIDNVYYTGRSQGNGMIWKGKRCAKQN
jgi:hypothetical protein